MATFCRPDIEIGRTTLNGSNPTARGGTPSGCKEENEAVANKQIQNIVATPLNVDLIRSAKESASQSPMQHRRSERRQRGCLRQSAWQDCHCKRQPASKTG
jgi:hypothetical protein